MNWNFYKTEGYNRQDELRVEVGVSSSGNIRDGVAFQHVGEGGLWVISFSDLEKIYLKAKAERGSQGGSHTK